jgi:hypothetical protein
MKLESFAVLAAAASHERTVNHIDRIVETAGHDVEKKQSRNGAAHLQSKLFKWKPKLCAILKKRQQTKLKY